MRSVRYRGLTFCQNKIPRGWSVTPEDGFIKNTAYLLRDMPCFAFCIHKCSACQENRQAISESVTPFLRGFLGEADGNVAGRSLAFRTVSYLKFSNRYFSASALHRPLLDFTILLSSAKRTSSFAVPFKIVQRDQRHIYMRRYRIFPHGMFGSLTVVSISAVISPICVIIFDGSIRCRKEDVTEIIVADKK